MRILFCSSCLSAWRDIVVFRRPRTAGLEKLAAGGGGKTPETAAYACLVSLELEMFEIGVGEVKNDAYCTNLVSSDSPGPKDEIPCVICR